MQEYYQTDGSLNANLWATGFARAGFIGVFISSIILYMFLVVYDSLATDVDFRISSMLIIAQIIPLANSGILVWIVNHSGVFLLLLIFIHPRTVNNLSREDSEYKWKQVNK
ncbi:hypothetical protein [Halorubrum sp. DTA46]|uniref:hypothetical protein n=1 Tax=Halorubrum sp. DTA46 TaxID=3402162 RepID=UPI003AAB60BB